MAGSRVPLLKLLRFLHILSLLLLAGTYIDKKCPFTGTVSIRGRIIAGTCHSAKMNRTIIVRRNYLHFVKKYQRQVNLVAGYQFYNASLGCLFIKLILLMLMQVREEALQYSCSHFTVLPC